MKKHVTTLLLVALPLYVFSQITDTGDKIGIGLNNPTEGKLHILQSGPSAYDGLAIEHPTNTNTIRFWVDDNKIRHIGAGIHSSITINGAKNIGLGIDNSPTRLGIYSEQTKFISFYRFGLQKSAHIGYGTANNGGLYLGTEDNQYTIWVQQNGSVGIGTYNPNPDFRLSVNGKIRAKEIKVETGWADYVFKEGYDLPTLEEVEQHIKEKGHLINIPSAKEVEENGIHLGEMNMRLLEKIEELTLYVIELEKKNAKITELETRLQEIEKTLKPKQ